MSLLSIITRRFFFLWLDIITSSVAHYIYFRIILKHMIILMMPVFSLKRNRKVLFRNRKTYITIAKYLYFKKKTSKHSGKLSSLRLAEKEKKDTSSLSKNNFWNTDAQAEHEIRQRGKKMQPLISFSLLKKCNCYVSPP